ncbi:MAG: hypothetical protein J5772_03790 [Clostridia bacterium]|nr:hypothetical protein [Clostridia bacterium]
MKKNWIAKVAALMLALTLITSCFVGSTFAKYVTKAQGEDNARVAKWGILLTAAGTPLFESEYETDDTNGYEGLSVKSDNGDNVVAPGTHKDGFTGTITGTPEVAVRYELKIMKDSFKDIVLPAGEGYTDYTYFYEKDGVWDYHDTFDLDKDYAPLKWDVGVSNSNGTSYLLSALLEAHPGAANAGLTPVGASATDAIAIMSNTTYQNILKGILMDMVSGAQNVQFTDTDEYFAISMDFEPGCEMDYTFTLEWTWSFENNDDVTWCNDKADTYIGNVAAGVIEDAACITDIELNVIATATQID